MSLIKAILCKLGFFMSKDFSSPLDFPCRLDSGIKVNVSETQDGFRVSVDVDDPETKKILKSRLDDLKNSDID